MRTTRHLLWALQPNWYGQLMEDEEMGASRKDGSGAKEGGMKNTSGQCQSPLDPATRTCGYERLSLQAKHNPSLFSSHQLARFHHGLTA